jgi:hypothetical protein
MRQTRHLKRYFKDTLNSLPQELRLLLKQRLAYEKSTIFNKIKYNLLKHEDANPESWSDEGWFYGHVAIILNKHNQKFACNKYNIPELGIEVSFGRIIPIGNKGKPGMRLVWEKAD